MGNKLVKEGGCPNSSCWETEWAGSSTAHSRQRQLTSPSSSSFSFCLKSCVLRLFNVKTVEIGPKQAPLSSSYT